MKEFNFKRKVAGLGVFLVFMFLISGKVLAQPDRICGYWLTEDDKSQVYIYKGTNGKYYGKIVWIKDPADRFKQDMKNPDPAKREQTILGMVFLFKLEYNAASKQWMNGFAYDPESGNSYDCYVWIDETNPDILNLKGFVLGMKWAGRKTAWKRDQEPRKV